MERASSATPSGHFPRSRFAPDIGQMTAGALAGPLAAALGQYVAVPSFPNSIVGQKSQQGVAFSQGNGIVRPSLQTQAPEPATPHALQLLTAGGAQWPIPGNDRSSPEESTAPVNVPVQLSGDIGRLAGSTHRNSNEPGTEFLLKNRPAPVRLIDLLLGPQVDSAKVAGHAPEPVSKASQQDEPQQLANGVDKPEVVGTASEGTRLENGGHVVDQADAHVSQNGPSKAFEIPADMPSMPPAGEAPQKDIQEQAKPEAEAAEPSEAGAAEPSEAKQNPPVAPDQPASPYSERPTNSPLPEVANAEAGPCEARKIQPPSLHVEEPAKGLATDEEEGCDVQSSLPASQARSKRGRLPFFEQVS